MSKHKHIDAVCVGITVFTLLLTLLFMNGKALGITAYASEENSDALFTANDLDDAWDTTGATRITLSDGGSTVKGNGAYVNDGDVHIVYAGKYVLSGELSDGSVVIEADGDDKIWLMLDGVSIHCEDSAAIRVEQAGKVFLTLPGGTENALSSGASFGEKAVSAGVDGTIYSRDDLTVNGTGSLRVTAEYQHGIVCNDDFVVTGGVLSVTSAQDAIHANDSVRIKDADLTLSAGDDGITASNDDETSYIYVESGTITIPSCYEGMEAVQITIAGGTIDIDPTDDGINANGYGGNSVIRITGGDITITDDNGRDADGIDSNKDIYISGGRLFVSVSDNGGSCAIDCGTENGGVCQITGGTVLACGSSGMAEGFDASSPQGFLMQTVSAAAGTTVTVKDAGGNELISEKVPCSFSSVLVSTPEMKVGDTCTLAVGDTETEIVLDNSSSSGGFGGGRMRGGFGLGGGQMPGWGGFGRNGGALDGAATGENQDSGSVRKDGSLQAAPEAPVLSPGSAMNAEDQNENAAEEPAPSDVQSGEAPPAFPGNGETGGMQPPELPDEAQGGGTPMELPENEGSSELPFGKQRGNWSDFQTNGENGDETQSGIPQGGWDFGGRAGGGNMRAFNGNLPGQEASSQADAGTPVTAETWLLLGVSAMVLLVGCVIAMCYKRRG